MKKKLTLGKESESEVAGVCSGIAEYFDTDVAFIRIIALLLTLTSIVLISYAICWIAFPKHPSDVE